MTSSVDQQTKRRTEQEQDFKHSLARFARKNALQLGIISVFLLLWLLFIVGAPRVFLAPEIYAAFMSSIPFFGIMALPLTLVIIAREIDLSFGSIMAVGMTAFVLVFELLADGQEGSALVGGALVALAAALVVGFLVGLINGIIVVKIGIPSLITTIGTQFFWRGVVLVITSGQGFSLINTRGTAFREVLVGRIGGYLPIQMVWMVLIGIAMWILLNRHRFGAHVYLVGDNENSARLMGVNVDRTRMLVFGLIGVAAAFAGVLASMEVNYFWPATLGEGHLMRTLAAVFLGGTSVFGGTGTIVGTFLACFIVGTIEAGTVSIGLTGYFTQLIFGLIIVVSVAMHTLLRKRLG
ncbi:MAG: ABC transporter permease [Anaerolineae bacterium]|nr:ABC transporter permease [Anaerolineae bacterium]